MTAQNIIAALIVIAAVGYIVVTVRRQIRSSRQKSGCGSDCNCGK